MSLIMKSADHQTHRHQELTAYMCVLQFIWHRVGMSDRTLQLARSLIKAMLLLLQILQLSLWQ